MCHVIVCFFNLNVIICSLASIHIVRLIVLFVCCHTGAIDICELKATYLLNYVGRACIASRGKNWDSMNASGPVGTE